MKGSKLGDYNVVRLIGRGGMGAVYEAHNPRIKRRVAIKQLLPEYTKRDDVVRRFHNEAVAVNAINHPGVVQVSEVGKAPDGSFYLVMEFLEGETLADRLVRSGNKLTEEVTTTVSWQLAGVLAAAHAKSIVHRDIKPGELSRSTSRQSSAHRQGLRTGRGPVHGGALVEVHGLRDDGSAELFGQVEKPHVGLCRRLAALDAQRVQSGERRLAVDRCRDGHSVGSDKGELRRVETAAANRQRGVGDGYGEAL